MLIWLIVLPRRQKDREGSVNPAQKEGNLQKSMYL